MKTHDPRVPLGSDILFKRDVTTVGVVRNFITSTSLAELRNRYIYGTICYVNSRGLPDNWFEKLEMSISGPARSDEKVLGDLIYGDYFRLLPVPYYEPNNTPVFRLDARLQDLNVSPGDVIVDLYVFHGADDNLIIPKF